MRLIRSQGLLRFWDACMAEAWGKTLVDLLQLPAREIGLCPAEGEGPGCLVPIEAAGWQPTVVLHSMARNKCRKKMTLAGLAGVDMGI